jgi:predicted TIM-barrel fold metal-dependent hydrolase
VADIVGKTLEMFGAERCLFGSNFPIEKLWTSYGELVAAYRSALADQPQDVQDAVFAGTAVRVYRL